MLKLLLGLMAFVVVGVTLYDYLQKENVPSAKPEVHNIAKKDAVSPDKKREAFAESVSAEKKNHVHVTQNSKTREDVGDIAETDEEVDMVGEESLEGTIADIEEESEQHILEIEAESGLAN